MMLAARMTPQLTISSLEDHDYMVERGYGHEALNAMSEAEFLVWLSVARENDRRKAEAQKEAIERARQEAR